MLMRRVSYLKLIYKPTKYGQKQSLEKLYICYNIWVVGEAAEQGKVYLNISHATVYFPGFCKIIDDIR